MNALAILEVAIGIIFVWFLLSILVSTAQEAIANIFQWRGKGLEQAIRQLLQDPAVQKRLEVSLEGTSSGSSLSRWWRRTLRRPQPAYAPVNQLAPATAGAAASPGGQNAFGLGGEAMASPGPASTGPMGAASNVAASLGSRFYNHPLISSLSTDIQKHRPSYIPAGQFAEVVFDLVVEAGSSNSPLRKAADRAEQDLEDVNQEIRAAAHKAFQALLKRAEDIPAGKAIDELVAKDIDEQAAKLVEKYPFLEPAVLQLKSAIAFPPLLGQLSSGIDALGAGSPQLARSLNILVTRTIQNTRDADEALAKARRNVEAWFDNSMQRLSGAYKRRVQIFAFIIGLTVALVLNLDSLAILRSLYSDPSLRTAIAAQAQQSVQTGGQNESQQSATQILDKLTALQLPIGWTLIAENPKDPKDTRCQAYFGSLYPGTRCIYPAAYDANNALYRVTIWQSIVGIFITALATMQGSPFWFGVLSRIVNMRASTPPAAQPAKS